MKPWQRKLREQEILDLVLAHAETPNPSFTPILLIKELDQIRGKEARSIKNLQAKIMICLAARVKPTMARRSIRDLRDKYEAMENPEGFVRFEERMKSFVGNDVVVGHEFAPKTFATADHSEIWDQVKHVFDLISKAGFVFFLNSGTLLGVIRDGKLIDHDDDIDVAVRLTATGPESAAREWMELHRTLDSIGLVDHAQFAGHYIIKLKIKGDFQMDLFPSWVADGRVFIFPHTFGELPEADVFPTQSCTVTGLPIPKNSENVLAINYGEKWLTPDPYFKFNWIKSKKTFSEFLKHLEREARKIP